MLKVDSGRKIPCCTRESNHHQYCTWLFGPTVYQLSYSALLTRAKLKQIDDYETVKIMYFRYSLSGLAHAHNTFRSVQMGAWLETIMSTAFETHAFFCFKMVLEISRTALGFYLIFLTLRFRRQCASGLQTSTHTKITVKYLMQRFDSSEYFFSFPS